MNLLLIGENIHIISKNIQTALITRNQEFVLDLIKSQSHMDCIDLNVGPAKESLEGIFLWLCKLIEANTDLKISFDSSNFNEIKSGLSVCKNAQNAFINSTSADKPKLEKITDLAKKFNSNIIALTMNKELGIPKTADERLALAFEIFEKCQEKNLDNKKIFFDPLILPVSVEQSQAQEAINTIQMIKQSFDPEVMTIVGLSNISNGSPKEIRPLINRVFATLAQGAGLDAAIINSFDFELIRILKMLENNSPKSHSDELLINLSNMIRDFSEPEEIPFDKNDSKQVAIIKTAKILLNKEIYSHSYCQN